MLRVSEKVEMAFRLNQETPWSLRISSVSSLRDLFCAQNEWVSEKRIEGTHEEETAAHVEGGHVVWCSHDDGQI